MVLLRTVKAVACYEQSICPYALTLNFLFDTVGLSDVFPGGTRHRHTHTEGMCTPVSLGCRCPGHRLTGARGTCQSVQSLGASCLSALPSWARPGPWVCEEALAPSTDNGSA